MYTLTRKLTMVCLAVVLSVLAYGCGGGGSSQPALVVTDVNTAMVTTGLTPDSGTYPIQPGGTANAGDVTFACEGSTCEVTVADDGTVTSTGGMVTAMDSASAIARVDAVDAARVATEEALSVAAAALIVAVDAATEAAEGVARVDTEEAMKVAAAALIVAVDAATLKAEELKFAQIVELVTAIELNLAPGYGGITPDTYIIEAGAEMIVDDNVSFECPAGEFPCVVIVTAVLDMEGEPMRVDVNVISLGGVATVGNTMAVVETIESLALYNPLVDTRHRHPKRW